MEYLGSDYGRTAAMLLEDFACKTIGEAEAKLAQTEDRVAKMTLLEVCYRSLIVSFKSLSFLAVCGFPTCFFKVFSHRRILVFWGAFPRAVRLNYLLLYLADNQYRIYFSVFLCPTVVPDMSSLHSRTSGCCR
jgi:hypothetical protein